MLEGILVDIIDASLLRKAMQSCSGVDNGERCDRRHWFMGDDRPTARGHLEINWKWVAVASPRS
jgi:hypothetical protein